MPRIKLIRHAAECRTTRIIVTRTYEPRDYACTRAPEGIRHCYVAYTAFIFLVIHRVQTTSGDGKSVLYDGRRVRASACRHTRGIGCAGVLTRVFCDGGGGGGGRGPREFNARTQRTRTRARIPTTTVVRRIRRRTFTVISGNDSRRRRSAFASSLAWVNRRRRRSLLF